MEDIRTYPIGNGEITLTAQDAEELRIILQTEHYEKAFNELIDQRLDCFKFRSARERHALVENLLFLYHDDITNVSLAFEETMLENLFLEAERMNLVR